MSSSLRWLGMLAGCVVVLVGCDAGPSADNEWGEQATVETTEHGRFEMPLPTRSPGALDDLLRPLEALGVAAAPEQAVQEVHAAFGGFVEVFDEEAHLVVLDTAGQQARAGVAVIRLVDDAALVREFRAQWVAALIDRFGGLAVEQVGGEPVLVGAGPGGAVLAWQPDVRTFLTVVGPDAAETRAVAEEFVRAPRAYGQQQRRIFTRAL